MSGADPGYWCAFLIPSALILGSVLNSGSCIYTEISILSCGLLLLSLCWKCIGWDEQSESFLNFCSLLISLVVALILWWITSNSFLACYAFSHSAVWFFSWSLFTLLSCCPSSFTTGEAIIVTQSGTLFLWSCILTAVKMTFNSLHVCDYQIPEPTRFLQVLLLGCAVFVFTVHKVPVACSPGPLFVTCLLIGALAYVSWSFCLGKDPVVWLLVFSFWSLKRTLLIIFWFLFTCASVAFVSMQSGNGSKQACTTTRKYFHVIIVLIYFPGVIWDPELLYVASGIALSVFIFLEVVRVLKIPPVGQIIDDSFKVFLDEKDSGILVLTHIYLLVGCSCPLWLYPKQFVNKDFHISLLSGVISVGLGDTAASIGGSIWGNHTWSGTNKTFEGTLCAIAAQLIFVLPLLWLGHVCSATNLSIAVLAVVLTSLLEAKTTQVDNLILPLLQFCILSLIN